MNRCVNHFGSKCNFSCAVGHRLNGSSALTCVAPGNRPPGFWDHPMPFCEGLSYLFLYLQATSFLVLNTRRVFDVLLKRGKVLRVPSLL